MAKGRISLLHDAMSDDRRVGRKGERLTVKKLKLVNALGRRGKIVRNVYLPKENGESTEIDILYITRKGIFVIESKNYSGWIFGDEMSLYWAATLPNGEKNYFYNPVRQNQSHIHWLSLYLQKEIPLFSLIVFSERCELKKITLDSKEVCVIKRNRLSAAIRKIWKKTEDALTEEEVDWVYQALEERTKVDRATKAAHIRNIEERYSEDAIRALLKKQNKKKWWKIWQRKKTCPNCGGQLVLRTAMRGANAGSQFYGCSNYPKCRFTKPV